MTRSSFAQRTLRPSVPHREACGLRARIRRTARVASIAFVLGAGVSLATFARAESGAAGDPMKSLDEQVQEIKSEVLAIGAELSNLEERLLYPSNSQIAVFVSLEEGETLELDSIRLSIDGEVVTHYVYSWKELDALRKGGVQRLYTGNVPTGEHRLEVAVAVGGHGDDRRESVGSFVFEKDVEPELVGIELGGRASGDASISVGSW